MTWRTASALADVKLYLKHPTTGILVFIQQDFLFSIQASSLALIGGLGMKNHPEQ